MRKLLAEKRAARAKLLETLREKAKVISSMTHTGKTYPNSATATVGDDRLASELEKAGDWAGLAALWSRQSGAV